MNFVGHAVAALWQDESPAFGLGAMLPDFATMCQGRLGAPRDATIAAGVSHHHRADAAFHRLPLFLTLYKDATGRLGRAGLARGAARGAAHVAVELALDGELVREERHAHAYLTALAHGHPARSNGGFDLAGWPRLHERLTEHGVPHAYRDPTNLARILERILSGRPLLQLAAGDEARLRGELPSICDRVAGEAEAVMHALAARLSA
jgi:hypothetical protein